MKSNQFLVYQFNRMSKKMFSSAHSKNAMKQIQQTGHLTSKQLDHLTNNLIKSKKVLTKHTQKIIMKVLNTPEVYEHELEPLERFMSKACEIDGFPDLLVDKSFCTKLMKFFQPTYDGKDTQRLALQLYLITYPDYVQSTADEFATFMRMINVSNEHPQIMQPVIEVVFLLMDEMEASKSQISKVIHETNTLEILRLSLQRDLQQNLYTEKFVGILLNIYNFYHELRSGGIHVCNHLIEKNMEQNILLLNVFLALLKGQNSVAFSLKKYIIQLVGTFASLIHSIIQVRYLKKMDAQDKPIKFILNPLLQKVGHLCQENNILDVIFVDYQKFDDQTKDILDSWILEIVSQMTNFMSFDQYKQKVIPFCSKYLQRQYMLMSDNFSHNFDRTYFRNLAKTFISFIQTHENDPMHTVKCRQIFLEKSFLDEILALMNFIEIKLQDENSQNGKVSSERIQNFVWLIRSLTQIAGACKIQNFPEYVLVQESINSFSNLIEELEKSHQYPLMTRHVKQLIQRKNLLNIKLANGTSQNKNPENVYEI